jgi:predicted nucleic acid-binding Zn ribbon protein
VSYNGTGSSGYNYRPRPKRRGKSDDPRFRKEWSGPGPDKRDPELLGNLLPQIVRKNGWTRKVADASVFGRWEAIVGPDIASHCRPQHLENGELLVVAESTAWATQLRLFSRQIHGKLAAALGPSVVKRLKIVGPQQPTRSFGPRRVRFNGSRDTF